MAGSIWPLIVDGEPAYATDLNRRFEWFQGHLLPLNAGGNPTNKGTNLGTAIQPWGNLECKHIRPGTLRLTATTSSKDVERFDNDPAMAADSDNRIVSVDAVHKYFGDTYGYRHLMHYKSFTLTADFSNPESPSFDSGWDDFQFGTELINFQGSFSTTDGTLTIPTNGTYDIDILTHILMTCTASSPTASSYRLIYATSLFLNGDIDWYIQSADNHQFFYAEIPRSFYFSHNYSREYQSGDVVIPKYKLFATDGDLLGVGDISNLTYYVSCEFTSRKVR